MATSDNNKKDVQGSGNESGSGAGLPYLVIKRGGINSDDEIWGPVTAVQPTGAVRNVVKDEPTEFTKHTEFEVYPVGVGPEGDIEKETVSGDEI